MDLPETKKIMPFPTEPGHPPDTIRRFHPTDQRYGCRPHLGIYSDLVNHAGPQISRQPSHSRTFELDFGPHRLAGGLAHPRPTRNKRPEWAIQQGFPCALESD